MKTVSFVAIAVPSVFKLNPSFAAYLTKLGNGGNCFAYLVLKAQSQEMRRLPCSLFIYFLFIADIRICSFRYIYFFRGKEFGLARNQLSWGCETDPDLDSCWESHSDTSLQILQGFCSSASCLFHLENRYSSAWNTSAEKRPLFEYVAC